MDIEILQLSALKEPLQDETFCNNTVFCIYINFLSKVIKAEVFVKSNN